LDRTNLETIIKWAVVFRLPSFDLFEEREYSALTSMNRVGENPYQRGATLDFLGKKLGESYVCLKAKSIQIIL